MPWACAMPHIAAGSTAPPRWTWSSVSSSPRGCGTYSCLRAKARKVLTAGGFARPGKAVPRSTALLSARRWPAHAAAAARPRGLALGVRVPDGVAVVVGGADLKETIPDLGAPELLLRGRAVDRALEHDVAVIRRADEAPAVLGQEVDEPRDLGELLRRVGDELAEPAGVAALAAVGTVELVANGPEDVDQDV